MATSDSFYEYVVSDVLRDVPEVTSKRMFGGYGFYLDGRIFAFTTDDGLYFKVGDSNQQQYEDAGSEPFVYEGHTSKGPVTMPYWTLPESVMNDPPTVRQWAEQSASLSKKK